MQPASDANLLRKHMKSSTLRTGGVVLWSQWAYGAPKANAFRKQLKSSTFRTGGEHPPNVQ